MKLLQALIVLLCFCLKVEAQQMNSNHVMRGGDKMEWLQVLYTADGMVIGEHELGNLDTHQSCSLSLGANIRGVYVLALTVNGEVFSEKFIY